jgi:hypothetical protein
MTHTDYQETVNPYWNARLGCTSETCHQTLPCPIHSNNSEVREILDQVAQTAREIVPELLPHDPDPPQPAFVYRDCHVFRAGGARVCTTTSHTMARRICNALNHYTPNDRGY